MTLPIAHPAEVLSISPEALEIANCYLQCQNVQQVSEDLALPQETVAEILDRREVRSYINHVFADLGFNNRFRMREALDAIIKKKFQEMDEADTGSSKDITDILALSHKITMDTLNAEIRLAELHQQKHIKNQVNVQINDNAGSNYGNLIQKLLQDVDNKPS